MQPDASPRASLALIATKGTRQLTMPKEFKKRGKRGKKSGGKDNDEDSYIVYARPEDSKRKDAALAGVEYVEKPEAEVAPRQERPQEGADDDAEASTSAYQPPERFSLWPLLDADTKAYFKQLEEKIVELEELNAFGRGPRADGAAEDEDELDGEYCARPAMSRCSASFGSVMTGSPQAEIYGEIS